MNVIETDLPGVLIVEPKVLGDNRGFFVETYHEQRYRTHGIDVTFVQDNHSRSKRGTLRGLHAQVRQPQGKLIRVTSGEIFDVAVDIRPDSPTYGRWTGMTLSAENFRQCYIPPGFAHGFCVLSESADVQYKCTSFYDPQDEISIAWDDPSIGIRWPIQAPTLSKRDKAAPQLSGDSSC